MDRGNSGSGSGQPAQDAELDIPSMARLAIDTGSAKSSLATQNPEPFRSAEFTAMMMQGASSSTPPDHTSLRLTSYQYEALPNASSIRLFKRIGDRQGLPAFVSKVIDLDATHDPYHCLSYTWANPHADGNYFHESYAARSDGFLQKTWPVVIDGSLFLVHKNLFDALQQLPETPWVDRLNHRDGRGRALIHEWAATGAEGISASDISTSMALHALAKLCTDDSDIIKATVAAGADVSLLDNTGKSALHVAAQNGQTAMARSLVTAGVGVDLQDVEGKTAAEYASENGHDAIADYLSQHQDNPGDHTKPPSRPSDRPDDWVWIDAISINQDSPDELHPQVRMMDRIYSQAVFVKVWLGEEDPLTTAGIDLIRKFEPHIEKIRSSSMVPYRMEGEALRREGFPGISQREWFALGGLYRRQWFRRAWVFQEMVTANDVVMFCGRHSIPYHAFARLTKALLRKQTDLGIQCSTFLVPPMDPAHHLELNLSTMADYAALRGKARILGLEEAKARFSMGNLLRETRTFSATKPHDKVYSLLGLSTIATGIRGPVDYSLPVEQLFTIVARQLISEKGSLDIFSDCIDPTFHKVEGLPSWTPDLSLTVSMPIPVNYRASGDLQQESRRILNDTANPFAARSWYELQVLVPAIHEKSDPSDRNIKMLVDMVRATFSPTAWNELHIRGVQVDRIAHVGAPRSREANSSIRLEPTWFSLAEKLETTYPTGESRSEAFWRTLCGNWDQLTGQTPDASFGDQFRRFVCIMLCGEARYRALKYGKLRTRSHTMLEAMLAAAQGKDHVVTSSTDGSVDGPYFAELRPLLAQLDRLAAPESGHASFFPSAEEVRQFGSASDTDIFDETGMVSAAAFSQPFDLSYLAIYRTRRLYTTEKGYLGLGPASVSPGDTIWIIPGHDKPVILRDAQRGSSMGDGEGSGSGEKRWRLAGETYVHGIMDGEHAKESGMEDLVLV